MLANHAASNAGQMSPAECLRVISQVVEDPASHQLVLALKQSAREQGWAGEGDSFERMLLRKAALESCPQIDNLPVHSAVKALLRDEFQFYSRPAASSSHILEAGRYDFVVACRMVSFRRFPTGPMDWEISGLPRSWLFSMRLADLPRALWFLARRQKGFAPAFFMHTARRPKNRGLLIEKEVLRGYYRMARSLEMQPSMKGILGSAWFFDPAAVSQNPHLEWLNRPYLQEGGLITVGGPAPADAGFLERNLERKAQYDNRLLQYRIGIALWPREAAIDWARRHPELDS